MNKLIQITYHDIDVDVYSKLRGKKLMMRVSEVKQRRNTPHGLRHQQHPLQKYVSDPTDHKSTPTSSSSNLLVTFIIRSHLSQQVQPHHCLLEQLQNRQFHRLNRVLLLLQLLQQAHTITLNQLCLQDTLVTRYQVTQQRILSTALEQPLPNLTTTHVRHIVSFNHTI
jgi:serine phosphatase RsbU (regulator of sigma subunit)